VTGTRHKDALRAPRIRQRLLVRRGHPDPERVRRQLHDALSTRLADALASVFAATGAPHDDSVWRIRKLTLDLTVDARWDALLLARAWASRLVMAVRRAMQGGGDGVVVMRWESPAAYLAGFVREAADGTAGSRWWFETFSGLRLLPRSAQIRTALVRDAPLGAAALVLLPAADVALVVAQLSTSDARRVLDAIASGPDVSDLDPATTALLEAHRKLDTSPSRADTERWALRLVVEALRIRPRMATVTLAGIARAMARLSQIAAGQPARMAVVRRLLADGNAAGLRLVLGDGDAERLAPLARAGRPVVEAISDRLTENVVPGAPAGREPEGETTWMPIAAPLILTPFIAKLPLDHATRGWPGIGGGDEPPARSASPASLVRLFALAAACGGERGARVVADPTARMLAGVGDAVSIEQMREWLGKLGVDHAADLEQTVGDWRARSGTTSDGPWLLADAGSGDEPETAARLVLMDCARGYWIGLHKVNEVRSGGSPALQHWLGSPPPANGPRRLIVLTDDVARIASEMTSGVDVHLATGLAPGDRASDPIAATLAGCDRLAGELGWLALPDSLGVPQPVELALAVVAQGLLRDLAGRLPGFARASLPHLWINFLAIGAQLEHTPQRLVARLGRPPLAMVLAMSGIIRATYSLPWSGATQISLFSAEAA
jgi:hypothetical protein